MTKRLYFFCLFLAAGLARAQTPTVTSVTYDSLSHSTIRIDFQVSGTPQQGHIRYIDTTKNPGGVCTDGASGVVQSNGYSSFAGPSFGSYQMVISGLTPGDTYSFCPEVNGTTGGSYSAGGPSLALTMPGIPKLHPAVPIAPATFPTGYPSDVGTGATLTLGTDCPNLTACLSTAINNQLSESTTILVPAGVPASSTGGIGPVQEEGYLPVSPDVVNFSNTQVNSASATGSSCSNTTPNAICVSNHGFTENQQAVFGQNYSCLPGNQTATGIGFPYCNVGGNSSPANKPNPFPRGLPLTIHVLDANTFQVYLCPMTNRSCPVSQGTLITFADQGGSQMRYVKYPRALHTIVVRTATPDSQFVPLGSMVQGPPDGTGVPTRPAQWVPKMGNVQIPLNALPMFTLGDSNFDPMRANIRFVGLHFSYTDTTEPSVSGDPMPGGAFFQIDLDTSGIVWDRNYFDAPGTPFRTGTLFGWNGLNNGFFGNYVAGMESWFQAVTGLGVSGSGTTATVASGSNYYGAGAGTLANAATLTLSGSSTLGQQRMYLYFTMNGTFDVVPPPGVNVAVSGVTNYHIVSVNQGGNGVSYGPGAYNGSNSTPAFPTTHEADYYYIDPITSSNSSCSSKTSLFSQFIIPGNVPASTSSGFDLGLTINIDSTQYLCGLRFYKLAAETPTTHTLALWSTTGSLLTSASTSNESASGWQTATLASPYQLLAGSQYVIGYHTTNAAATNHLQFQNADYYNATMHVSGAYISSNGNGDYTDKWPEDYMGNAAVGVLGWVDVTASGTVADAGNVNVGTNFTSGIYGSVGNGMIGGCGPGPYMMIGNMIWGSGLPWHFDNSCARWGRRGDYTLERNYHYSPGYALFTLPSSDGMDYRWRQPLEWKGGQRIRIYGDIFDTSMKEGGSIAMIALQSPGEVTCVTDADLMYNTFKHGPGTLGGGIEYGGGTPMSCPPVRTRYAQNISWDISGTYQPGGGGPGWLLTGQIGAEDVIVDHNTDMGRSGGKAAFFDQGAEFHIEGVQVTNNILQIDSQYGGLEEDSSGLQTAEPCQALSGQSMAACHWTPSYVMRNNPLISLDGSTQSQIENFWPNYPVRYIPASNQITAQGFYRAQNSYSYTTPDPDLRLKTNRSASPWCASCANPAGDLRADGADIDLVAANQGKVTFVSANATGNGTATIAFDQPDSGSCILDYGTEPTVTTFTRVSQTCAPGTVRFNLTGLASGAVYYFRYDGAVQQPVGHFRTR